MRKMLFKSVGQISDQKNNLIEHARSIGVNVGEDCRIFPCNFGSEPYLISIGNHVTITNGVSFITHDGGVWVFRNTYPEVDYIRPIVIFDNCFIGMNAIILPGVTIGPNSIIGAGSVVTKSVPPDSVAVGVPARVIKSLDEYKKIINKCLPTKLLSREEKRKFLLDYFGNSPEKWLEKMHELDNQQ